MNDKNLENKLDGPLEKISTEKSGSLENIFIGALILSPISFIGGSLAVMTPTFCGFENTNTEYLTRQIGAGICLAGLAGMYIGGMILDILMDKDEQKRMDSMSKSELAEYMDKVYIPKNSNLFKYPR